MDSPAVKRGPSPADALPMGAHSSLQVASIHKKMVSGVLHLKKESAGHRGNPSAYNTGAKAFKKPKLKMKVG